jgi:hypothetical protein
MVGSEAAQLIHLPTRPTDLDVGSRGLSQSKVYAQIVL